MKIFSQETFFTFLRKFQIFFFICIILGIVILFFIPKNFCFHSLSFGSCNNDDDHDNENKGDTITSVTKKQCVFDFRMDKILLKKKNKSITNLCASSKKNFVIFTFYKLNIFENNIPTLLCWQI